MRVLFAASECAPFVKTGGLADVVSALPKALAAEDISVTVVLPVYPSLKEICDLGTRVATYDEPGFGRLEIVAAHAKGIDLLLVRAPHLYDRAGSIYLDASGRDWPDNHLRFGALSKAAARIAQEGAGGEPPDVLHAHDWQAGLAPAYLRLAGDTRVKTVTTIHNIAFQGLFPAATLGVLGLPTAEFNARGYEYYDKVSFLKAGLVYADAITTVSPTYARELMSPEFGLGFEGIIAERRNRLSGILNGVELSVWNPSTDTALTKRYDADSLRARAANRAALLQRFGLRIAAGAPLFCVVSRLTEQKGIDLLIEAIPALVARGAGLAVLGTGDPRIEAALRAAQRAHPQRVGTMIGYDERLSHEMMGGADVIVIPSRFEPCGLTQLYGLRYGCLPLVARTGGLADTLIDANEAAMVADVATGFQFAPVTGLALADRIEAACDLFADRDAWQRMMARAMASPVGWDRSAAAYAALYRAPSTPSGQPAGELS